MCLLLPCLKYLMLLYVPYSFHAQKPFSLRPFVVLMSVAENLMHETHSLANIMPAAFSEPNDSTLLQMAQLRPVLSTVSKG